MDKAAKHIMKPIDKLRHIVAEYGRKSIENYKVCRELGRNIIESLREFLDSPPGAVIGVPPHGDWDINQGDYRDEVFSTFTDEILLIKDVQLGISIRVDNLNDSGSFWMRIVVNLRKEGERFLISIGDRFQTSIPVSYETNDLKHLSEEIFGAVLRAYEEDVNVFVDGLTGKTTIGFLS